MFTYRICSNMLFVGWNFRSIFNEGEITQIKGGQEADELRKAIRMFGPARRQIYELGVGTNPGVKLGTSAQEEEKALGAI